MASETMADAFHQGQVYRWWALTLAVLVQIFVVGAAWTIMPVLFGEISQPKPVGLGLSLVELGVIWGIFSLATALFSIPMGMVADKYDVRWVVGLGVMTAAVAGSLRALSGSFSALLIWMFLFGIGYSTIRPSVAKLIGTWFPPDELGMSNGIVMGSYGLGAGLAIQFGGSLLSPAVGGWRNLLFFLGAVIAAIGILWLITARGRQAPPSQKTEGCEGGPEPLPGLFHSMAVALRTRDVWWLVLSQIAFSMGYLGAIGYLPIYLVETGLSRAEAHGFVSILLYAFVAGAIIIPMVSDRLGNRRWVYFVMVASCGPAVMATAFARGPFLVTAFFVWGFAAGGIVLSFVVPMEHPKVGPSLAGATIGLLMALGSAGGFVSPIVGNTIAAISGEAAAIVFWGGCFIAAGFCFLLVKETHPGRIRFTRDPIQRRNGAHSADPAQAKMKSNPRSSGL